MPRVAATAKPSLRPGRLPQRTCVACGDVTTKRDLVRVVRTPAGAVIADPTGKQPGRGAYLHPRPECWELAIAKGRLERSLHTRISEDDAKALRSFAADLRVAEVL